MLSYAEVHKKAIEEAENLLKELHKTENAAIFEEKRYCDGYTLLKNSYPLSQRLVTREEITGFGITDFDLGDRFRLCYADNGVLYGTSFRYDLLPEERHVIDSINLPPELSEQFSIQELEARTIYQSVTIDLTKNECEKKPLQFDGGIYFENSVIITPPDSGVAGETIDTIFLQQDDEPGMLVRYEGGSVEDLCPGFYAVDNDVVSFKVAHCGRTPYYIEHIRTQHMIQDIVRVKNLHTEEKIYYLLPFHSILSVNDLFILRERLFYISHGSIYDANNGAHVTPIYENNINGIVCDGDHIYYQEGSIIVKLFIGHRPYEILNREEWDRDMEAVRRLADDMENLGTNVSEDQTVNVVLDAILNGLPSSSADTSFESTDSIFEESFDSSFDSMSDE